MFKLSHLTEHKFKNGFNDTIDPTCPCGTEVETTEHFLLRCHFYSALRLELSKNVEKIDPNVLNLNEKDQGNLLLYVYQLNKRKSFNQSILNNIISHVEATAKFSKPLVSFKQRIVHPSKSQ